MKRFLLFIGLTMCSMPAFAQNNVRVIGRASDGVDRPILATLDGKLMTDSGTTSTTPSNTTVRGGSTVLTGQVAVGTTATLVAAARAGRQRIGVTVVPAVQCAFGPAGVTLATGWPLAAVAYAADNWDTSAALYGVCATTATTVAFREMF